MKQLIAATILMLASLSAVASQLSAEGLTEAQAAQVAAEVAKLRAENTKGGVIQVIDNLTTEDIDKYAKMGQAITTTITETAKGLGMAVDEFMNTSTGVLIMFLIVYHFFGVDILILGLGMGFIIPFTIWMSNRISSTITIAYYMMNEKGKKVPVFKNSLSGDDKAGIITTKIITTIVILVEFLVIMANIN